jgi:hypothetical protein
MKWDMPVGSLIDENNGIEKLTLVPVETHKGQHGQRHL